MEPAPSPPAPTNSPPWQIGNSSAAAPSGVLNTVQYYLDTPINQPQGNYTGDITFTAVTNP
jgi:hypothetical protein